MRGWDISCLWCAGRLRDLEWEDSEEFRLGEADLKEAVQWIAMQSRLGRPVVVNCAQGRSRSAALATAYLMAKFDLDMDSALQRVQEKRPFASPNPAFRKRLRELEVVLRSSLKESDAG